MNFIRIVQLVLVIFLLQDRVLADGDDQHEHDGRGGDDDDDHDGDHRGHDGRGDDDDDDDHHDSDHHGHDDDHHGHRHDGDHHGHEDSFDGDDVRPHGDGRSDEHGHRGRDHDKGRKEGRNGEYGEDHHQIGKTERIVLLAVGSLGAVIFVAGVTLLIVKKKKLSLRRRVNTVYVPMEGVPFKKMKLENDDNSLPKKIPLE
eukprot:m.3608 g.3608  ORF g.3608 m.3608 type:complete len:201 (+) comp9626_c0_seq1:217-819(+)